MRLALVFAVVLCLGCNQAKVEENPGLSQKQTEQVQAIADTSSAKATKELASTIRGAIEAASEQQQQQMKAMAAKAKADEERAQLLAKHQQTKAAAAESKRRYDEDIRRAASLNPEEQTRLREIARKRTSGEMLNRVELEFARKFHEFEDFVESESKRMAADTGVSIPFTKPK